jgi:protein-disulfide isomerase
MVTHSKILAAVTLAIVVLTDCRGRDGGRRDAISSAANASAAPATPVARTSAAMPTDSISERADRGRIRGKEQAGLWIIEASDFQCPFCKMWHDSTYGSLVKDYVESGKARLAYLNFPLSQHRNAMPAAEAAMCASVQNKFWPMHDSLFSMQQKWETLPNAVPAFDSLAARLGVAMPAWRDCVARHLTRPLIEADYARSQSAGVRSTPTFFVGDQQLAGFQSYTFFRQVVEAQLAKRGSSR